MKPSSTELNDATVETVEIALIRFIGGLSPKNSGQVESDVASPLAFSVSWQACNIHNLVCSLCMIVRMLQVTMVL
jgi:hypothetical protein